MKNALIVSYYFPPAGGPGVQRVARHVKYLRNWGYNPIVIAAAPEDYARPSELSMPIDESLSADIPADVEIHRVPSCQPFGLLALLKRFHLEVLRDLLFVPDSALTWIAPVIRRARRIAEQKEIDLIYTSVKPHSTAVAGFMLKRLLRKPWIIDFRDPWTQYFLASYPTRLHYCFEQALERSLVRHADRVITASPAARENLLAWCSFLRPEAVQCITNGYDPDGFAGAGPSSAGGALSIVYTGVFCGGPDTGALRARRPASWWRRFRGALAFRPRSFDRTAHSPKFLLDAFRELVDENPRLRNAFRLVHAGPGGEAIVAYARRLSLEGMIETRGYLTHRKAVRCLRTGDAALLCLADSPKGERNDCIPQKLFEYLGARKPILALVPEGDARDILERAGTAIVCPPRDLKAIKKALLLMKENWHPQPEEEYIRQFERPRLTQQLAALCNPLTSSPSGSVTVNRSSVDKEITVIIPARNRATELERCLAAIERQDYPHERFEVLVCDDGSDEDLQPVVGRFQSAGLDVRLLRQESRGPAAARNLGIRSARGSIIAMTDSDTIPERRWLGKLCEAFQAGQDIVGVEGFVSSGPESDEGPLAEGPTNLSGGVYLTCNCAYRKDALVQVGGFDEAFPLPAYEDTELAARVLRIGRIAWQPDAVVIHPKRPLKLRTVWKKLRHWKFVLIMGLRYGYLGWRQYPARYPRLRVAALATVALPFAKWREAVRWIGRRPLSAVRLAFFGVAESLGAVAIVLPQVLLCGNRVRRGDYLRNEAPSNS